MGNKLVMEESEMKRLSKEQKIGIGVFLLVAIIFFAFNNPFAISTSIRTCEGNCLTNIDCNPCLSGETASSCYYTPSTQAFPSYNSMYEYCSTLPSNPISWSKQCTCTIETCDSHEEKKCYSDDVYWYDSCGNREERDEECDYGCDNGQCEDEPIQDCTTATECGTNGYVSDNYCFESNVVKDFKTFTCSVGECGNTIAKQLQEICTKGCTNGVCDGSPCIPDCINKECGTDGCSGSCGECDEGKICTAGICKKDDRDNTLLYIGISLISIGGLVFFVSKGKKGKLIRRRR